VPGAHHAHAAPFAGRALSRSVVIALAVLFALTRRTTQALLVVGWIDGGVQAFDVLVGTMQGDPMKRAGPGVLAAFTAKPCSAWGDRNRPRPDIDGPDDQLLTPVFGGGSFRVNAGAPGTGRRGRGGRDQ
jgi:hypothetical protein